VSSQNANKVLARFSVKSQGNNEAVEKLSAREAEILTELVNALL